MSRRVRRRARRLAMARNVLLAVFLVSLLVALVPQRSEAAASPGSAGTFTALPSTDSQVSVSGRGDFSGMTFTVNQTRNLVSQAVSINWTGGKPTKSSTSRFQENYVQVMQCWGDDDGTNPANPGPPPEQCVYGAADGLPDSILGGLFPSSGQAVTRIISRTTWANYNPAVGTLDPQTGLIWRGFRSVDGSFVGRHTNPDYNPFQAGSNFWLNPLFNSTTTNEVPGGRTGPNGEGSTLFRIDTGVESSGLGCGQRLVPAGGGAARIPKCWIVIVPRGAASVENAGTPFEASADTAGVYTSPLAPEAWANRVAVPLDFNPVDIEAQ